MEREEETSLIGGQWKNILAWWLMEKHFYLVVNGKRRRNILDWGLMEKHPCLVVNGKTFLLSGQWKEKKKHSFRLLPLFSPKDFFSTLFPLI
jgi:hypothetical protein